MRNKFRVERALAEERRHSELLKDRYATIAILGSSFIAVIFLVVMVFHVLLTPSIFLLLCIVSVGTALAFLRHREEKRYGEGIDAFYLQTKYVYEKMNREKLMEKMYKPHKNLTPKQIKEGYREFT